MALFLHELKRGRLALIVWCAAVSFLLSVSILIYPEMATQMNEMTDMFASMGSFTQAFGMDQLNFGEFMGYFAIECGNQLGLGGALFAGILGASALSREEKDKTAEFLLTNPVSRPIITANKLFALLAELLIFTACVGGVSLLAAIVIGESFDLTATLLLFLAYLLLEIEIALVAFGVSAFIKSGGIGIGLGIGLIFYFVGIISNLTEQTAFLKYLTPFSFANGGNIVNDHLIEPKYLVAGAVLAVAGTVVAFLKYRKKDIC